ncbi:uncharacterized protein BDZ99DRAFT_466570 [Mytilinidion resinicola]|uniref:Uncharacterized protein n=1 Tax=Mytilinidion resinicola TaxID=574789 RepID=A0A6A6YAH1_9PEZI|nr:uncharacterized protein BDZ99DRAFT_466570 [Mytilinidion resinicola]KAF2805619.1 hypothetical protein BDZ99DRAFT_466570 [Mytilinidion resinicola]
MTADGSFAWHDLTWHALAILLFSASCMFVRRATTFPHAPWLLCHVTHPYLRTPLPVSSTRALIGEALVARRVRHRSPAVRPIPIPSHRA